MDELNRDTKLAIGSNDWIVEISLREVSRGNRGKMILRRWISKMDGRDWFAEDIERYESGVITGRWISGGQIQQSPGAEDARSLLGGESELKR